MFRFSSQSKVLIEFILFLCCITVLSFSHAQTDVNIFEITDDEVTTVTRCDELASHPGDLNNPKSIKGVNWLDIEFDAALLACKEYLDTNPSNARAQYLYGRVIDRSEDFETAVVWYTLAAEQGYVRAQINLGSMYENGEGIEQNYETAVGWYTLAAEQDDAFGQNNLAYMYETGQGVEQNHETAAYWYTLAAEQGVAYAQARLGSMYETGQGVEQNHETSIYWYTLAAEQGVAIAQNILDQLQ